MRSAPVRSARARPATTATRWAAGALASVVLAATLASPFAARAEKSPAGKAPAKSPPQPTPSAAHASALVHIATEIARGLGQVPAGALVAVSPLASDVPAPKGDELATRVAAHVAGRLGHAHAHPQPVTLASARSASGRAASLVYVDLKIESGELRATADLYPVVSNVWDRLRTPAPGPRAHVFVAAPIDAEVRTFLKPIVLEQAKVLKAEHDEADVLAVGCGDVDADGGLEIALLTRSRVALAKLRGGKVSVVRSTPWTKLASRVPVPLREPIATVVFPRRPRGELLVGSTDRGAAAIDASLVPRRELAGLPIPGAGGTVCALPVPEDGAFDGELVACAPPSKGAPEHVLSAPAPRADAIAVLDLAGKDGNTTHVVAAREPSGRLLLRQTDARGKVVETEIDSAGAQLVLADLDLDGVPEIAVSSDGFEDDALTISSWRPSGLVERLKIPAKDGVRALAACPPEERGLPGLVAVVGSEVWLVR